MYLFWRQYLHLNVVEKDGSSERKNMKMTGRISLETYREFIVLSLAANGSEKSLLMFTYCCLHSALDLLPSSASLRLFSGAVVGEKTFRVIDLHIFIAISHNFHNSDVLHYQRYFPRGVHSNHVQQFVEKNARRTAIYHRSIIMFHQKLANEKHRRNDELDSPNLINLIALFTSNFP